MNTIINEEVARIITNGSLYELWKLYQALKINYPELRNNKNIEKVEHGVNAKFDIRRVIYELNFEEDKKNEEFIIGDKTYDWFDVKKELEEREALLRAELMNVNMVEDLVEGGFER
jgi:hypothetical protein